MARIRTYGNSILQAMVRILLMVVLSGFAVTLPAQDEDSSLPKHLETLGLNTTKVGRVTAHFAPADQARAEELAVLAEKAAAYFEREFGITFELGLAVLGPDQWFSKFQQVPYAIPWPSIPDRLIFMPSSLEEGVLIYGPTELENRRRVDFVLLHEYGHIAAKEYFRPSDLHDYLPVSWFDELLATYFAYAFIRASDPAWAESAPEAWLEEVQSYTPSVLSLDWSFMSTLSGGELARTYGWYQFMLNLRAAEIYDQEGLGFLRSLKEHLQWHESATWTTASLLPLLETMAPGFHAWEENLPQVYGEQIGEN